MSETSFLKKYARTHLKSASLALYQVQLEKKIALKLPYFHNQKCLLTPLSLEQSTSEIVAIFKSTLISGDNILTLASGIGVDDWAFSKSFKWVTSVDIDSELNALVDFNFELLDVKNFKRISSNAETFLNDNKEKLRFDFVYIDPDRRSQGKKEILLSEHQPNVIQLLPEIKKITSNLIIKCSPLYDHQMALKELENIYKILVISVKGEVKEMLLFLDFESNKTPQIECIDLHKDGVLKATFALNNQYHIETALEPETYFYEVGASIVKVRKQHEYASYFGLKSLHQFYPFYTSHELKTDFIGRSFLMIAHFEFKAKVFAEYLVEKKLKDINLKIKGLKFDSTQLFKKLKIKEGGEDYFYIFESNQQINVWHLKRI